MILPSATKVGRMRLAVTIWSIALFGTLSVLTFQDQLRGLFEG
jgi:hypothetical protein